MNRYLIRTALFILAALLLSAPASWATSKGYCYIIGYSFAEKKAFFSPIILQQVNSKSYSKEEFVTDMELIQKLETQFQSQLSSLVSLDAGRYTISARGAYKSAAIANHKFKDEISLYETRGFDVKVVKDFKFED